MKIKIIKFLIKKNGFFDRERLVLMIEKTLFAILVCRAYKIFLKTFCKIKNPEIKKQKHHMERISDYLGHINTFSKIKFKITKKYGK